MRMIPGFGSSSKGYQSHGIYRYLGSDGTYQGGFKGCPAYEIIWYFHKLASYPDSCVIFCYLLDYLDRKSLTEADCCIVEETTSYQSEEMVNGSDHFQLSPGNETTPCL